MLCGVRWAGGEDVCPGESERMGGRSPAGDVSDALVFQLLQIELYDFLSLRDASEEEVRKLIQNNNFTWTLIRLNKMLFKF